LTRQDPDDDAEDGRLLFDLPLEPPDRAATPPEFPPAPTPPEPQATAPPSQESRSPPTPSPSLDEFRESYSQPLDSQTVVTREPVIAHLWPRILSSGADLLLHAGALAALALGLQFMAVEPRLEHWPSYLAFMAAFSFLYTVVSLSFWGQTAGMAWFGLAARESPQFPLSFAQAAVRWLGGLVTVALAGLPLLLALSGSSLTDRMSRSKTYQGFPAAG